MFVILNSGEASGATLLPNWDVLVDTVFRDDLITFANKGLAAPSKSRATAKFVLQVRQKQTIKEKKTYKLNNNTIKINNNIDLFNYYRD